MLKSLSTSCILCLHSSFPFLPTVSELYLYPQRLWFAKSSVPLALFFPPRNSSEFSSVFFFFVEAKLILTRRPCCAAPSPP
uniref:Uncharacterized protein n=1 Tax=Leishmania guyanensis TaxID=5670 RepID=A0A1E1J983_LEIGU|nr:Hypothetical protein BN36_NA76600 [Leishmania guyanensis]CCM20196.1 Hypothetical protein BN36_NA76940 [Leishmania guyanensis]